MVYIYSFFKRDEDVRLVRRDEDGDDDDDGQGVCEGEGEGGEQGGVLEAEKAAAAGEGAQWVTIVGLMMMMNIVLHGDDEHDDPDNHILNLRRQQRAQWVPL